MKKTIKKERFYQYPIDQVWQALTDPQALSTWFMKADFKPEVGYQFTFQDKPQGKWDGILKGEVLLVEQPNQLSYTWKGDQMKHETQVKWQLIPHNEGTLLRLEHAGFQGFGDVVIGFFHQLGWPKHFKQLDNFLEHNR
ncbi:MAG: SRPBCC domain-containing protein [Chloroflexota bacterium]